MRKFIKNKFYITLTILVGLAAFTNAQTYTVETIAGGATFGFVDGTGTSATFKNPDGVAIDGNGNIIITDRSNHAIRKMTAAGVVTTIAGKGTAGYAEGKPGQFNFPWQSTIDKDGNVIVVEKDGARIRSIATDGTVSTVAGTGVGGFTDGGVAVAQFNNALDAVIDSEGNIFVADRNNRRIRKITLGTGGSWATAVVSTVAGNGTTTGTIVYPISLAIDKDDNLFVSDDRKIKKITKLGDVSTVVGAGGVAAFDDGTAEQPLTARLGDVYGLNFDNSGNLILADATNHRIRKVTPGVGNDWTTALVTTIAGTGAAGKANGLGNIATLNLPYDVVVTSTGVMYVADTGGHLIRKITPSTLPVGLSYFDAFAKNNNVSVKWQTVSEQRNSHFEILKSSNGIDFNSIGKVYGAGNSNLAVDYSFTDYNPTNGANYYQLEQVDEDGKSTRSVIRAVNFNLSERNYLRAYVNPNQQVLQLNMRLEEQSNAVIRVTDMQGKIVYEEKRVLSDGLSNIEISVHLQKGTYVVSLQGVRQNLSTKFIY